MLGTGNPIFRLFIDARSAFPYPSASPAKSSTAAWSQTAPVSRALNLLSESEKDRVLRYYFPRDAALSLSSFLLKRLAIVRACGVEWADVEVTADREVQNGKPYFKAGGIEFNVSHHGEAVTLVATTTPNLKVGIDLVRADMEKDARNSDEVGFEAWVRIFSEAFSEKEIRNIVGSISGAARPYSVEDLRRGFRCFYAHWALKEAYFKMTGDALLASWLRDLEFCNVRPPAMADGDLDQNKWGWGQVTSADASLRQKAITSLKLELVALGEHYMVATVVSDKDAILPPFQEIKLNPDILPLAT